MAAQVNVKTISRVPYPYINPEDEANECSEEVPNTLSPDTVFSID